MLLVTEPGFLRLQLFSVWVVEDPGMKGMAALDLHAAFGLVRLFWDRPWLH